MQIILIKENKINHWDASPLFMCDTQILLRLLTSLGAQTASHKTLQYPVLVTLKPCLISYFCCQTQETGFLSTCLFFCQINTKCKRLQVFQNLPSVIAFGSHMLTPDCSGNEKAPVMFSHDSTALYWRIWLICYQAISRQFALSLWQHLSEIEQRYQEIPTPFEYSRVLGVIHTPSVGKAGRSNDGYCFTNIALITMFPLQFGNTLATNLRHSSNDLIFR